jgi:phosphate-selective porin OprO and OprP
MILSYLYLLFFIVSFLITFLTDLNQGLAQTPNSTLSQSTNQTLVQDLSFQKQDSINKKETQKHNQEEWLEQSLVTEDLEIKTPLHNHFPSLKSPSQPTFNFRFRIQNRLTFDNFDEDHDHLRQDTLGLEIRRLRLRLEGSTGYPDFSYNLQFSFSRRDQDWDTLNYPNILRDANVTWTYHPHHRLIFGLRKLPGNRQRVISSGAQEFVDRSIANSVFNIDRDTGIQSWHDWFSDTKPLRLRFALTSGEGRGQMNRGLGLAQTLRLEWLPLGAYLHDGDYFEGDLSFESQPKLSLGVVLHQNQNTYRLAGQTGQILVNQNQRTLDVFMLDANFKFQGWSWSTEFFQRQASRSTITPSQQILTGQGFNSQISHTFSNSMSLGYRISYVNPDHDHFYSHRREQALGLSYYLNQHLIKIQGDIAHETESTFGMKPFHNSSFRLQMEYGL